MTSHRAYIGCARIHLPITTYSLYEAPSADAVRKAAALNELTVTNVNEAPVDLDSETDARSGKLPAGMHRYMIERTFPAGALAGLDSATKAKVNATNSKFGAQWVTSYANSDETKTYCIYNAADEAAVRAAAKANGLPVDKITEVPCCANDVADNKLTSESLRAIAAASARDGTPSLVSIDET